MAVHFSFTIIQDSLESISANEMDGSFQDLAIALLPARKIN